MFLAIGATRTPPDQIALAFIQQRGLTEADLDDSSTSTLVVRKYLLTRSGEKDDHRTIADTLTEGAAAVGKKVGDVMNARDRSIPYGDEQKKWTYRTPVRITGQWWLATERDALTNGLAADAADGLQGAFSAFESSLKIATQTDDMARWVDHQAAARELHQRVVHFSPDANSGEQHVAMGRLREELLEMLNESIARLEQRIDPAAVVARNDAMKKGCRVQLQEVSQLMRELDVRTQWQPKVDEAMVLIGDGEYVAAFAKLNPIVNSLRIMKSAAKA